MHDTTKTAGGNRRHDIIKVSGVGAGQRRDWQEAARSAGMPLACWLREAADAALLGGTTAADLRADILKLRTDLGRGVGNNVNQIAQALHRDGRSKGPADTTALLASLAAAAAELSALRQTAEALLRRVEPAGHRRGR